MRVHLTCYQDYIFFNDIINMTKSEVSIVIIVVIYFHGAVSYVVVPSYLSVVSQIYISRKMSFVFCPWCVQIIDYNMALRSCSCFAHLTIYFSSLCSRFIGRHWTYKMLVRYFVSSMCLRLNELSQLYFISQMGLYVFSFLNYPVVIVRICVLYPQMCQWNVYLSDYRRQTGSMNHLTLFWVRSGNSDMHWMFCYISIKSSFPNFGKSIRERVLIMEHCNIISPLAKLKFINNPHISLWRKHGSIALACLPMSIVSHSHRWHQGKTPKGMSFRVPRTRILRGSNSVFFDTNHASVIPAIQYFTCGAGISGNCIKYWKCLSN